MGKGADITRVLHAGPIASRWVRELSTSGAIGNPRQSPEQVCSWGKGT